MSPNLLSTPVETAAIANESATMRPSEQAPGQAQLALPKSCDAHRRTGVSAA